MPYQFPTAGATVFAVVIIGSSYIHPFAWELAFVLFVACLLMIRREQAIAARHPSVTPMLSIDVWLRYRPRIVKGGGYLLFLIVLHLAVGFRSLWHAAIYLFAGYVGFDLVFGPFLENQVVIARRGAYLAATLVGVCVGFGVLFLAQVIVIASDPTWSALGSSLLPIGVAIVAIEAARRFGTGMWVFILDFRRAFYAALILQALLVPVVGSIQSLKG